MTQVRLSEIYEEQRNKFCIEGWRRALEFIVTQVRLSEIYEEQRNKFCIEGWRRALEFYCNTSQTE